MFIHPLYGHGLELATRGVLAGHTIRDEQEITTSFNRTSTTQFLDA